MFFPFLVNKIIWANLTNAYVFFFFSFVLQTKIIILNFCKGREKNGEIYIAHIKKDSLIIAFIYESSNPILLMILLNDWKVVVVSGYKGGKKNVRLTKSV